jgi:hypothetical protein
MDLSKRLWIGVVGFSVCARLLPHPWNFTPMMAAALFAGYEAASAATGVLVTLSALALSDAIMGFYGGFWYVYAASLLPVALGRAARKREGIGSVAAAAAASSVSFFLVTNFMVWATGRMYPHTLSGLGACFAAALPFYRNEVLGDAFYTLAIFGSYALLRAWIRPIRQAA